MLKLVCRVIIIITAIVQCLITGIIFSPKTQFSQVLVNFLHWKLGLEHLLKEVVICATIHVNVIVLGPFIRAGSTFILVIKGDSIRILAVFGTETISVFGFLDIIWVLGRRLLIFDLLVICRQQATHWLDQVDGVLSLLVTQLQLTVNNVLLNARNVFPHRRIKMVFDLIISPSNHDFGNVGPPISKCFVRLHKLHLLSFRPLLMIDVRIEAVVPPVTVVLRLAVLILRQITVHTVCNKTPFAYTHELDDFEQLRIFIRCKRFHAFALSFWLVIYRIFVVWAFIQGRLVRNNFLSVMLIGYRAWLTSYFTVMETLSIITGWAISLLRCYLI